MSLCWPYLLPSSLLTPVIECWILDSQATTYTHHTLAHIYTRRQTHTYHTYITQVETDGQFPHYSRGPWKEGKYGLDTIKIKFVINLIKLLQLKLHIYVCVGGCL